MFGAAQGRALQQVGQGLGQLSAEAKNEALLNDKRQLVEAEAEMNAALSKQAEEIKALQGQARLDAIQPKGHPGLVDQGDSALAKAEQSVKDIAKKYDNLTGNGQDSLTSMIRVKGIEHDAKLAGMRDEGQRTVDKQLMGNRVASSIAVATAAIGTVTENVTKAASLAAIESAVRDPQLGLAKQAGITDPAQIDTLVGKQQVVFYDNMITKKIAMGDLAGAVNMLKEAEASKASGTPELTQLQAKVLPFQEELAGRTEFAAVVKSVPLGADGTPSVAALMAAVNDPTRDPQSQKRLQVQLGRFISQKKVNEEETLAGEMNAVGKAIQEKRPVTVDMIPTLMRTNPLAALSLVSAKSATISENLDKAADQTTWEAGGGGKQTVPEARTYLTNLATRRPGEFLSVMKNKALVSMFRRDDYEAFEKRVGAVQKQYDDARAAPVNYRSMLGELGVKDTAESKAATRLISRFSTQFDAAVNSVRTAALDQGKTVDSKDIKKAMSGVLVRVLSEKRRILPDVYDYTAASDLVAAGGDPMQMRLENSKRNAGFVASVLGTNVDAVTKAMNDVSESDRTLTGVAKKLGAPAPTSTRAHDEYETALTSSARSAGYPSDFIRWMMQSATTADGKPIPRTPVAVSQFIMSMDRTLAAQGTSGKAVFQQWVRRQGGAQ